MSRRLLLILVFLALAFSGAAWWWAQKLPGAGGLHQFAPSTVRAGAPFEVKVLAGVWGEGGPAERRYKDWSLQLLQGGQAHSKPVAPISVEREGERLVLRFRMSAPHLAAGAPTSLTWQVQFVFDGQAKQVAGTHEIMIEP